MNLPPLFHQQRTMLKYAIQCLRQVAPLHAPIIYQSRVPIRLAVRSLLLLPPKTRERAQGHGRLAKSQTEDRQFGGSWAWKNITYPIGYINQRKTFP
jgi:hypothetical protein